MSANSKIEWTEATWNPVTGCTKISEGCAHCYAERMSKRLAGRCGYPEAPHQFDVTLRPDRLDEPLRWRKPRRVFVVSMGDLFHDDVPLGYILSVFYKMAQAERHTFQVLTKRPQRAREFFEWWVTEYNADCLENGWAYYAPPLRNVWLGVTAENQARADERIPILLQIPAAVRFVSLEPMLGPVDLSNWLIDWCIDCPYSPEMAPCGFCNGTLIPALDWVICGGETGPGARPMHPDWARSLRDQCQAAGVPFFFKQMTNKAPIPDDLMVREYPKEAAR